jgi:hypothetical protein
MEIRLVTSMPKTKEIEPINRTKSEPNKKLNENKNTELGRDGIRVSGDSNIHIMLVDA